jgi:hypothetical protein
VKNKKLTAVALVASLAAVMFSGCKQHILDGPGMINPASWDSFSVSRSDSYAQHIFYIQVEVRNEGLFVTGEVRGDDGSIYEETEGILLSDEEADALYALEPALLPDCVPNSGDPLDGVEILDAPLVSIEVLCTDGRTLEKVDEDDFSLKVYQIVLPCFQRKYQS